MSAQNKYNYFGLVIDANKNAEPLPQLDAFKNALVNCNYALIALIIHDQDTHDNGAPKLPHLHAYVNTAVKMTKKQMLLATANTLDIDVCQISVECSNNEFLLCQYLTHQNHPEKHQYSKDLILTNNQPDLDRLLAETRPTKQQQLDHDLQVLTDSHSILEVATKIGLEKANRYRNIYNQITQEKKQDIPSLYKELETYREFITKLGEYIEDVYFDWSQDTLFFRMVRALYFKYFDQIDID